MRVSKSILGATVRERLCPAWKWRRNALKTHDRRLENGSSPAVAEVADRGRARQASPQPLRGARLLNASTSDVTPEPRAGVGLNPLKDLDLTEGQTFGFPSSQLGFPSDWLGIPSVRLGFPSVQLGIPSVQLGTASLVTPKPIVVTSF
jgi:hypothetical protein